MIKIINTVTELFQSTTKSYSQRTAFLKYNGDPSTDNEVAVDNLSTKTYTVKAVDAATFTVNLLDLFTASELKYLSIQCFLEKLDATTPNKTLPLTVTQDAVTLDCACYELIDVSNFNPSTFTIDTIQGMSADQVARVDITFATKNS